MDRVSGYAAGILEIARAEGVLERVENELYELGRHLEGSLPIDRKRAIVTDLLEGRASPLTVSLVEFLVRQDLAGDLGELATELARQSAAARNRQLAEIRTAVPLDEATVERLAAALGRVTGSEVEVRTVVDPSIVGGIVARVGDTVIDGSVASKLESLRNVLLAR